MLFQERLASFDQFGKGSVVKVLYFLTLGKFRKIFVFTGICKKYNRNSRTFTLQNFHGSELVQVTFLVDSPYIVYLAILKNYNFDKTLKNLTHLKNYRLQSSNIISPERLKSFDPYDYIYGSRVQLAERRRLRRKFRI